MLLQQRTISSALFIWSLITSKRMTSRLSLAVAVVKPLFLFYSSELFHITTKTVLNTKNCSFCQNIVNEIQPKRFKWLRHILKMEPPKSAKVFQVESTREKKKRDDMGEGALRLS